MSHPFDKRRKQLEEQIFYNLVQIVQLYPQYTLAQHLAHVLRRKDSGEQFYFWSDEQLLKKFEDYKDELDKELKTEQEQLLD